MNFTPEQKYYILDRADNLVRSAVWRITLLLGLYMIIYYSGLPDNWNLIAIPLYWVGFGWMAKTQVERTKRILGFTTKKKKENKWKQRVKWLVASNEAKKKL